MVKRKNPKKTKYTTVQRRVILWDKIFGSLLQIARYDNTDVAKISNVILLNNINKELDKRGLVPEYNDEENKDE